MPPGMALLSKWFLPRERGFAIGAYTGALVLAYAGSYFVAGPLAAQSGWQVGILWTSIPSFLVALLVLPVSDSPPGFSDISIEERGSSPEEKVFNVPSLLITGAYMGHMWELFAFWGWVGPAMVSAATAAGYGSLEAARLGSQMAALLSWLIGGSLLPVILLGLWYGFWVVADSAIYKAGLTDLVSVRIRETSLGLQSALGFGVTIISPQIFGAVLDATQPKGRRYYWKSEYLPRIEPALCEKFIEHAARIRSPHSAVILFQIEGALNRLSEEHSPVDNRDAHYVLNLAGSWEKADDDRANIEWAREAWNDMKTFSTGGTYINFLTRIEMVSEEL
ncbi:hypothetical protein ANME2D_03072 [Candidatus Methanoperedens nitroreducens]|uniref:Uncharacterized protein n=1 Tax=Candidatus Methanoperedens nitratireducens TaxID=1392998 RepID=A0A062V0Y7_9EURY|nr:MFS transporter [Candidatus Methanoperedens nitroreducens]KCZ71042.1 hypothetical protein ANME2D_03072 [Candidatus Methanoperedens nitroreducens]MDJ1421585.1 MFS transporter [Candidatus Methanoperedens sp.]